MIDNLPKVKNLAQAAQVSTILFTGKGEPFMNYADVLFFLKNFREYWTEIQTNGIWLENNIEKLKEIKKFGLNVIAISIDNLSDMDVLLFQKIKTNGMISRVTFNITKYLNGGAPVTFQSLIDVCKKCDIHQMTLRNIVIPDYIEKENKQTAWIRENVDPAMYKTLREEMINSCEKDGYLLRDLEYGSKVFDYKGIAVSYSDYCIQDHNNGKDIRSLIFKEDGHVYTNWASDASVLF